MFLNDITQPFRETSQGYSYCRYVPTYADQARALLFRFSKEEALFRKLGQLLNHLEVPIIVHNRWLIDVPPITGNKIPFFERYYQWLSKGRLQYLETCDLRSFRFDTNSGALEWLSHAFNKPKVKIQFLNLEAHCCLFPTNDDVLLIHDGEATIQIVMFPEKPTATVVLESPDSPALNFVFDRHSTFESFLFHLASQVLDRDVPVFEAANSFFKYDYLFSQLPDCLLSDLPQPIVESTISHLIAMSHWELLPQLQLVSENAN